MTLSKPLGIIHNQCIPLEECRKKWQLWTFFKAKLGQTSRGRDSGHKSFKLGKHCLWMVAEICYVK